MTFYYGIKECPWRERHSLTRPLEGPDRRLNLICRLALPGLSRWLGRPLRYIINSSRHHTPGDACVWPDIICIVPGPGFLTVIVRRGLHHPPPSSAIYPMSAVGPQEGSDGVWLARGSWITKRHRDRPPTEGWIAWSYVPGPSGEIEFLVQGGSAKVALRRFWAIYDATVVVPTWHGKTPADRHLAWLPPEPAPLDLTAEDEEALEGLEGICV